MPRYRNIRVKMKGGKTRIQRARVLASGKLRFVKGKVRSGRRSDRRRRGSVRGKKDYIFTAARRRSAIRNLRKGSRTHNRRGSRRRSSRRKRRTGRRKTRRPLRRPQRGGGGGGVRLG